MAPYGTEFSQIDIPVLSIDGYYNDSQNSGLYYFREHHKYRPDAEHYLIIGPYSHFGAQREGQAVINGYQVDPNALINTPEITFQWFDWILKDGPRPGILKDKINYQVMGADEWRSAPSIEAMSNQNLEFYLAHDTRGEFYSLSSSRPGKQAFLEQEVDLADRDTSNNDYYPDPIVRKEIDTSNGFVFISEAINSPVIVNGSFSGEIFLNINKKDVDIGVTLYEQTPEGEYFHLSYYVGRASYAKDITRRNLLSPGETVSIPFSNTHLVSKQLKSGSRLVIAVNVNKNPFSQLNYATSKDVSKETIADAHEPLKFKWSNLSVIRIPVLSEP
jgi:predicted acyl esterase